MKQGRRESADVENTFMPDAKQGVDMPRPGDHIDARWTETSALRAGLTPAGDVISTIDGAYDYFLLLHLALA